MKGDYCTREGAERST